jgi:DeoR family deoxyribose operon repressor
MNKKTDRIERLLFILKKQGAMSIKDLARDLDVTEMTIRRDLQELSEKNLVKILHGGAIYTATGKSTHDSEKVYSYQEEITKNQEAKDRIGRKAASLVLPHDTIIIDTGTTTEYLAKHLREDIPLTALAYALNIVNEICARPNFNQIIAGGTFYRNTLSFVGSTGIELIRNIRASKVFISASGISDTLGVTSTNLYEIEIKNAAINSSHTRILLVDSSKFDQVKIAHFADMRDFDVIITDTGIPRRYCDIAEELGVEMYCV